MTQHAGQPPAIEVEPQPPAQPAETGTVRLTRGPPSGEPPYQVHQGMPSVGAACSMGADAAWPEGTGRRLPRCVTLPIDGGTIENSGPWIVAGSHVPRPRVRRRSRLG